MKGKLVNRYQSTAVVAALLAVALGGRAAIAFAVVACLALLFDFTRVDYEDANDRP